MHTVLDIHVCIYFRVLLQEWNCMYQLYLGKLEVEESLECTCNKRALEINKPALVELERRQTYMRKQLDPSTRKSIPRRHAMLYMPETRETTLKDKDRERLKDRKREIEREIENRKASTKSNKPFQAIKSTHEYQTTTPLTIFSTVFTPTPFNLLNSAILLTRNRP